MKGGYSARFLDHYRRPRNLGDLEAPDGMGLLHDDICGDLLRLVVRVESHDATGASGGGTILAARFKAFGCAATIAAGSVLTEMVTGLSLRAATEISADDLAAALGGLPSGRMHAAVLARAALHVALGRATEAQKTGATER